ncbi:Exported protein [Bacillus sp. IT-79MI2]|nr:hypothetical protein BTH41_05137 [Bacillus mycoides]
MKLIFISIVLLLFTMGIVISMDILQGLSIFHTLSSFTKLKYKMVTEDYI